MKNLSTNHPLALKKKCRVFEEYLQPGHMREQLTIKDLCAQAQIQSNAVINYRGLIFYLPTYSY